MNEDKINENLQGIKNELSSIGCALYAIYMVLMMLALILMPICCFHRPN